MKLFLISQDQNTEYATSSAVVAARDEETARDMDPSSGEPMFEWGMNYTGWCSAPDHVNVRYIGEATADVKQGVICASFNAG